MGEILYLPTYGLLNRCLNYVVHDMSVRISTLSSRSPLVCIRCITFLFHFLCHPAFIYLSQVEVLRICAAMDEMMDESKEEGVTPGRATAGKNSAR